MPSESTAKSTGFEDLGKICADTGPEMFRTALLLCGVLSSLLYVAMTIVVPMYWESYSSASQTVSELSAIGAPTRSLWVPLGLAYTLLVAAFGWACGRRLAETVLCTSQEVCSWPTDSSAWPGHRCIFVRCWQPEAEH